MFLFRRDPRTVLERNNWEPRRRSLSCLRSLKRSQTFLCHCSGWVLMTVDSNLGDPQIEFVAQLADGER